MEKDVLNVEGMSCNHCKMTIENNVGNISGVTKVEVDLEGKKVTVEHEDSVSLDTIKNLIINLGYSME